MTPVPTNRTYVDNMFRSICDAFDNDCKCTINGHVHNCPFKDAGDVCNYQQYSFEQLQELFNVFVMVKQFGRKWSI